MCFERAYDGRSGRWIGGQGDTLQRWERRWIACGGWGYYREKYELVEQQMDDEEVWGE